MGGDGKGGVRLKMGGRGGERGRRSKDDNGDTIVKKVFLLRKEEAFKLQLETTVRPYFQNLKEIVGVID